MPSRKYTPAAINNLKREAKKVSKLEGIPHVEALNRIAVREGFPSWWELQHVAVSATASRSSPIVVPSNQEIPMPHEPVNLSITVKAGVDVRKQLLRDGKFLVPSQQALFGRPRRIELLEVHVNVPKPEGVHAEFVHDLEIAFDRVALGSRGELSNSSQGVPLMRYVTPQQANPNIVLVPVDGEHLVGGDCDIRVHSRMPPPSDGQIYFAITLLQVNTSRVDLDALDHSVRQAITNQDTQDTRSKMVDEAFAQVQDAIAHEPDQGRRERLLGMQAALGDAEKRRLMRGAAKK